MKRLKVRKKQKISIVVLGVIALIFFFTAFFYKIYSDKLSKNVVNVAYIKLNEFMQNFLSDKLDYNILKKENLEDILEINKNDKGEILYVDYNLDRAYNILKIVTDELNESIDALEQGETFNYKNIATSKSGIAITVPLFFASTNALLSSLGPKIYVPIDFVGSVLTNIKSSIKDYGLNNALVELYVTVKITTNLIVPFENRTEVLEYDVLVASSVINGRVPEVYGGIINSSSKLIDSSKK